jgi:hypothetical protein
MTINLTQLGGELDEFASRMQLLNNNPAALGPEAIKNAVDLLTVLHSVYGHLITMAEQSEAMGHNVQTGYVIAGINSRCEFNKWSKAFGAKPYSTKNLGTNFVHPGDADVGVFFDIHDATLALEAMSPDIRKYFGIFPIVICAGNSQHSEVNDEP